jgi:hypothetical protein
MKIGKLDGHCGECRIADYCGMSWSDICICMERRFENIEEDDFLKTVKNCEGSGQEFIDNIYKKLKYK